MVQIANYVHPPGAGTLGAGGTPTGTDIEDNWYFPTAASGVSLEVINGSLDERNLEQATNQTFKKYHIQRGALSTSGAVGSTANLDYFWELFASLEKLYDVPVANRRWLPDSDLVQYYEPIPGANIEYYCPYDNAKVLLQWNVIWFNDGYLEAPLVPVPTNHNIQANVTKMQMFYTDSANSTEQTLDSVGNRKCPPGFIRDDGVLPADENRFPPWGDSCLYNAMFCRSWTGHKLVTLTGAGWYSAGLRTVFAGNANQGNDGSISPGTESIYQTRVLTRSMRYIVFKS